MGRHRRTMLLVGILVPALLLGAEHASGHPFGKVPYSDVVSAATDATRCSGLSKSELASMVFAPTWPLQTAGAFLLGGLAAALSV